MKQLLSTVINAFGFWIFARLYSGLLKVLTFDPLQTIMDSDGSSPNRVQSGPKLEKLSPSLSQPLIFSSNRNQKACQKALVFWALLKKLIPRKHFQAVEPESSLLRLEPITNYRKLFIQVALSCFLTSKPKLQICLFYIERGVVIGLMFTNTSKDVGKLVPTLDVVFRQISTFLEDSVAFILELQGL